MELILERDSAFFDDIILVRTQEIQWSHCYRALANVLFIAHDDQGQNFHRLGHDIDRPNRFLKSISQCAGDEVMNEIYYRQIGKPLWFQVNPISKILVEAKIQNQSDIFAAAKQFANHLVDSSEINLPHNVNLQMITEIIQQCALKFLEITEQNPEFKDLTFPIPAAEVHRIDLSKMEKRSSPHEDFC